MHPDYKWVHFWGLVNLFPTVGQPGSGENLPLVSSWTPCHTSITMAQERPKTPLVFLSAAAPDFRDPDERLQARQELQKYFVPPNETGKWMSHGMYHGRSALLVRVADIWHRIFTACRDLEVRYPSLLPMGLGMFTPKVAEADAISLYFEAQLMLLEDKTRQYGFKTVYINPGKHKRELLQTLSKKRWQFPCHLQVHITCKSPTRDVLLHFISFIHFAPEDAKMGIHVLRSDFCFLFSPGPRPELKLASATSGVIRSSGILPSQIRGAAWSY